MPKLSNTSAIERYLFLRPRYDKIKAENARLKRKVEKLERRIAVLKAKI